MRVLLTVLCVAASAPACSEAPERPIDAQDLSPETARRMYQAYEAALRAHRSDTLAAFYRPVGARIIVNGNAMDLTGSGIDSLYRGNWQGPSYFAFEDLEFEQISSAQILVTGSFRWLSPQSSDTGRVIYLAIVEQTDVGPRIRLEHETERPDARSPMPDSTTGG